MLKYNLPDFSLLIGSFDVTPYVTSFTIGLPIFEPSSPLTWTGDFEISYSPIYGLAESEFTLFGSPTRWRPDQQILTFSILGYVVAKLYIQRYEYNPQTRVGKASVYQIIDIASGDKPAEEVDLAIGERGNKLGDVVETLLLKAYEDSIITPDILIDKTAHTGFLDHKLTSRDPIKDAQDYASKNWRWLYVNTSNQVADVSGNPSTQSVIFKRALSQVEQEPITDNINFAAQKIIASGSRQVVKKSKKTLSVLFPKQEQDDGSFDSEGRNLKFDTVSYKKRYQIYPELYTQIVKNPNGTTTVIYTDTTEILAEIKTVERKYWQINPPYEPIETIKSDGTAINYLPQVGDFADQWKRGDLVQTITTTQKTRGEIFPINPGTKNRVVDDSYAIAEKIIETDWAKVVYKPKSLVDIQNLSITNPQIDTSLVLYSAEAIKTGRKNPDGSIPSQPNPNKPDEPLTFESIIEFEKPQPAPTEPLEEELIKGTAYLSPVGWTPFREKPHVEDFGFIPDQEHADMLATQYGLREARRRDAVQFTMELPLEWIEAGCKPLQRCWIHDSEYQMDELIIDIAMNDDSPELKFGFTGNKIGTLTDSVPEPPQLQPYIPSDLRIILDQNYFQLFVGGVAINYQFQVDGGIPPYTFVALTSLPTGLSLSSSGLLTGTPTIETSGSFNIQVTDSSP